MKGLQSKSYVRTFFNETREASNVNGTNSILVYEIKSTLTAHRESEKALNRKHKNVLCEKAKPFLGTATQNATILREIDHKRTKF